ncbi:MULTISPECIES: ABC transporter permease [unclassified Herbaspirillum]|uniref:ABC transporter permease n=1 Tax=unclassified Herbaspirillum TaxID=2624150 RepID=UPI00054D5F36|nr:MULTISPECIES: ABC transporter permease [unclassified Herbaspirillum]NUT60274.1 ABC transporter permease [Herbaspirillum sp. C9C3]
MTAPRTPQISEAESLTIEAGRADAHYWRDLWRFRELLTFLAWRDILVRYKQTVIGVAWGLIRPLLTMLVFTVIFGTLANLPSHGVPYPVLVFSALLPWQFFANALSDSSNSLLSNAGMISKVYFPRLIVPASAIVVSLVDFAITFVLLLAVMLWYGIYPDWRMLTLPVFILLALATSLGAGLWFAALNTKFRDFRYIVPFVVQFGLYVSPVGFSSEIVPEKWRLLYSLNPMVAVIDGFRWAVIGGSAQIYWPGFLTSVLFISVLLFSGIMYFRKTEKTFADVI